MPLSVTVGPAGHRGCVDRQLHACVATASVAADTPLSRSRSTALTQSSGNDQASVTSSPYRRSTEMEGHVAKLVVKVQWETTVTRPFFVTAGPVWNQVHHVLARRQRLHVDRSRTLRESTKPGLAANGELPNFLHRHATIATSGRWGVMVLLLARKPMTRSGLGSVVALSSKGARGCGRLAAVGQSGDAMDGKPGERPWGQR